MKKAAALTTALLILVWAFRPDPVLSHAVVGTTVTFDREIVRILSKKCLACHSENNLSVPFTSYEETRPWVGAIHDEVLRRHMPPWRAVAGYGEFANEFALTTKELQFFTAWIDGNGPKTKDQRLVVNIEEGTTAQSARLTHDHTHWQLGKPDLLKTLPANALTPDQGAQIRRVVIDLGLRTERTVRAFEYKPGDRKVVRAVFFSLQETGQWLGSWTPWYGITTLPDGIAYRLPEGAHIVAEIHYQATQGPTSDAGTLGIYFAPGGPARRITDLIVEATLRDDREGADRTRRILSGSLTLPAPSSLLAFKPELHADVDSFTVTAKKPDGSLQILLLVRGALPDWPTPYVLKSPVALPGGTELKVTYQNRGEDVAHAVEAMRMTVSVSSPEASAEATR